MGTVDTRAKAYLSDRTRFADLFNGTVYGGRQVVDPAMLSPLDATEIALVSGNGAERAEQRFRDVAKLWGAMRNERVTYVVLGIEVQTKVHYAMPVRVGLYDFINYVDQVAQLARERRAERGSGSEAKAERTDRPHGKPLQERMTSAEFLSGLREEDRLAPVLTLVLHLSPDAWDGPRSLHEMLDLPEDGRLRALVPDYQLNLIDPTEISDEVLGGFATDLGRVLSYVKHSKDKDALSKLVHGDTGFSQLDVESAMLINEVTGSRLTLETRERKVDMCKAIDDMRRESEEIGEKRGFERGERLGVVRALSGLVADGILTLQDAAARAGLSPDEFELRAGGLAQG